MRNYDFWPLTMMIHLYLVQKANQIHPVETDWKDRKGAFRYLGEI